MPTKSWKNHPQKFLRIPQIHLFFLTALTAQTAQTEKFMFQNVAFRPTAYRTGSNTFPLPSWVFAKPINYQLTVCFFPPFFLVQQKYTWTKNGWVTSLVTKNGICKSEWVKIAWAYGILLPKLFWPTLRKKNSSGQEKLFKFKAEGWEFTKILGSLEQFILTVKGLNNFL